MPPRKRDPGQIGLLDDPPCSPEQSGLFRKGITRFQRGEHWQAHELWEVAWRLMGDTPEDDAEIILRGLIQLAASYHCVRVGRLESARNNLRKATEKLALYTGTFWCLDIPILLERVTQADLDPDKLSRVMS